MSVPTENELDIALRRERIVYALTKGANQKDIATQLGVDKKTIERDIDFLEGNSQQWFDNRARIGFVFKYRMITEKLESLERDMQIMKQELDEKALALKKEDKVESASMMERRLKLIRAIEENLIAQAQFDAEMPTLQSLNKALATLGKTNVTNLSQ